MIAFPGYLAAALSTMWSMEAARLLGAGYRAASSGLWRVDGPSAVAGRR